MKKNKKKPVLVCEGVRFFCNKDEDAFFEWIKKIDCIEKISAKGRKLYLYIASNNIPDQNLDDLLGLFHRYKINMKQLRKFLTQNNKEWFYDNKKTFWHKKVFNQ